MILAAKVFGSFLFAHQRSAPIWISSVNIATPLHTIKVTLYLYHAKPPHLLEGEEYHFISKLSNLPIATPIRKILSAKASELER
jgi:hypothetical protein